MRSGDSRDAFPNGERVKESPAVFVFPWRSGPLAREIPDIFRRGWRRAGKFRNDDGLGVVAVWTEGGCRREGLTTGEHVKEPLL